MTSINSFNNSNPWRRIENNCLSDETSKGMPLMAYSPIIVQYQKGDQIIECMATAKYYLSKNGLQPELNPRDKKKVAGFKAVQWKYPEQITPSAKKTKTATASLEPLENKSAEPSSAQPPKKTAGSEPAPKKQHFVPPLTPRPDG